MRYAIGGLTVVLSAMATGDTRYVCLYAIRKSGGAAAGNEGGDGALLRGISHLRQTKAEAVGEALVDAIRCARRLQGAASMPMAFFA